MALNHAIKFYAISSFFKDNEKQLKRGENSYTSGHVKSLKFNSDFHPAILVGEVKASMKKIFYKIEITIDLKDQQIKTGNCSCPRGLQVCHHMAALLYYAHYNISSTDIKRNWGVTKSVEQNEERCKSIEEMFPAKPFIATRSILTPAKKKAFLQKLGDTNVVGFSWLLKEAPDVNIEVLAPVIMDILFSNNYNSSTNKEDYFRSQSAMDPQQIINVADKTVGQHKNENWQVVRKSRLTASKFGITLKAVKRNKFPPSLYKTLVEGYSLERVRAIQWGKDNEKAAITKFEEFTNLKVEPTGLWLHDCGFLGASPDGLIADNAILEVKCPYRFRNISIKDGVSDKKYLFHYDENNADEVFVNVEHDYYHQIQGQLYLTGRELCYFFVWTPNECDGIIINKNENWGKNINILQKFYMQKMIPYLIK